jgi:hypothetical protein
MSAKTLSNSYSSVTRQVLQRGEPPQRTGFSVSRQSLQRREPPQRAGFSAVRYPIIFELIPIQIKGWSLKVRPAPVLVSPLAVFSQGETLKAKAVSVTMAKWRTRRAVSVTMGDWRTRSRSVSEGEGQALNSQPRFCLYHIMHPSPLYRRE